MGRGWGGQISLGEGGGGSKSQADSVYKTTISVAKWNHTWVGTDLNHVVFFPSSTPPPPSLSPKLMSYRFVIARAVNTLRFCLMHIYLNKLTFASSGGVVAVVSILLSMLFPLKCCARRFMSMSRSADTWIKREKRKVGEG